MVCTPANATSFDEKLGPPCGPWIGYIRPDGATRVRQARGVPARVPAVVEGSFGGWDGGVEKREKDLALAADRERVRRAA